MLSTGTTASGMPTFATHTAETLPLPVGCDDDEPESPSFMHPLRNKRLPTAPGAMQSLAHMQENPMQDAVSINGAARRKLGLATTRVEVFSDNVVEVFDEPSAWLPISMSRALPPKKSAFSMRRLFARRV